MPFIIKASYEGQTRRWTQQSDVFPTYQSLSDQIHKIYKNVDNFYLTRVTFSPSAGDQQPTPTQFVLIANTVNSADEWTNTAAAPFLGVSYPTGMLKFIVNDKLSHKEAPNRGGPWANSMDVDVEPRFPVPPLPFPRPLPRGYSVPMPPPLPSMPSGMQPLPSMPSGMRPLPSTSMFPPPMAGPPPFIPFIPPPGPTEAPPPPPSAPSLRSVRSDLSTSTCCSVDTAKTEVKGMMESFLKDFQKTISDNFGVENGGDDMDTSSPIQPDRTPLAPNRPLSPIGNIPGAFNASTSPAEPVVHPSVICDLCNSIVKGIRYRCNECPDFDICEACMGENNNGAVIHNVQIDKTHTFKAIPKPVSPGPTPLPTHNASCDVCRKTIIGSRHKCLDCPDYDMCSKCFASQRDRHDSGHEFYEFKEPGKIVIHNVTRPFPRPHHRGPPFGHHPHHGGPFGRGRHFGGRGGFAGRPHHARPTSEESSSATGALNRDAPDVTVPPVGTRPQLVAHNATCDLCDSKIFGNRYKCSMCPDYDVCESCFSIVVEQHPKHPFVRIRDPKDVMVRSHHYANRTSHHARCDSCGKQIVGARFKCTHRDCPDFDLCENCEALPIEAHPSSHALIKLRHPIAFYEGLAGVLEYAKATKQKQAEMMDSARTQGATPEPSVSIWQPTVIRHVAEQGTPMFSPVVSPPVVPGQVVMTRCLVPQPPSEIIQPTFVVNPIRAPSPLRIPEEKIEQSLPSATNPFYMEPIVQESNDAVILEGEGERVQMPLPLRPRPSPVIVPAPEGKLVELTRAMSIKTESTAPSIVSTPSTVKSSLAEDEEEVAAVVVAAEAEMEVSVPPTEDSASPFGDVHAVHDKTEDDAASVVSAAPSVISLASTHSSVKSAPRPSATFVADLSIPDGQILPSGAFFVKSWKMLNDGEIPWPAGTRLAFTGGERFGTTSANAEQLLIAGLTPPGEMTEIRVEFRAPEVPGKYVSYWRLQDEEGRLFGHRIWCDVEVVEPQRAEDANLKPKSSESSLASSSIIIMPTSVASEAAGSVVASPVQEAMPTPTLSSFDGDASDVASHVSDVADDDVFSVADSDFQWEDASRPQSPDQFVMVYESSNDASDSDD